MVILKRMMVCSSKSRCRPAWVARLHLADGENPSGSLEFSGKHIHGRLLEQIQYLEDQGSQANPEGFARLLQECIKLKAIEEGRRLHVCIAKIGLENSRYLGNLLISMYGKCGSVENARLVFDKMLRRTVVSWTAMITAYAHVGDSRQAFLTFRQMQDEGMIPNQVTFMSILSCCGPVGIAQGKLVHACVLDRDLHVDVAVATAVITMYGKCWHMEDASRVFDALPERNVVSWTTMISSYGQEGYGKVAFHFFQQMQEVGLAPNRVTFLSVLDACDDLAQGKLIHSCCIANRMMDPMDVAIGNALLSMYGKSGTLDYCFKVFNSMPFRDIISWTAVISIISQHGEEKVAMQLFQNMQKEGIEPNELTFFTVLNTTVELGALARCRFVHATIFKSRHGMNLLVQNALISVYSRCGSMADACNLFIRLPLRDDVSWTAIISANMLQGNDIIALQLFQQMQLEGVEPAKATFVTILSACASLGALEEGKYIQDRIYTCGLQADLFVGTALITMYTKCGSLEDAYIMFNDMPKRDVVAWTTIIAAYAHHGDGAGALILFKRMCLTGFFPNDITLISILCACSHAGMTDEGHHIFISITQCYCMTPLEDHYHCIIDVLGRGGWVEEAEDFIDQIATSIGIEVWRSFLGACRNHDVVAAGSRAADYLISIDPEDPAAYILLANTYATH